MALSKEFLQGIIRKFDNDDTLIVESFDEKPAVGKGENFMSIATRITVLGKRKINGKFVDFTRSLFQKVPVSPTPLTVMMQADKIFCNETMAYNIFIPTLQKYSKKEFSVPKCYYADNNQIILQDLIVDGYEMNIGKTNLEKEQYTLIIKKLACLHAANITMKFKDKEKYESLGEVSIDIFSKGHIFKNCSSQSIARIKYSLEALEQTEEIKKALTIISNVKDFIFNKIADIISDKRDTDVYNHGDCWMNNMLFKDHDKSVKLLDLQCMRKTSVAADLNYFLNSNLTTKELINNKLEILDTYLDELHECMKENGCEIDLIKRYDIKWLTNEMDRFSLFGFLTGLWLTPVFYLNKEEIPSFDNTTEEIIASETGDENIVYSSELEQRLIEFVLNYFKDKDINWKL